MRSIHYILSFTFLIIFIAAFNILAIESNEKSKPNSLQKINALNAERTLSNINNWSYWLYSDGKSAIDPNGSGGGIYPRGTSSVLYQDGLVWGARVNDEIRVGGQTYRIGTQPLLDHIYRIRADWKTLTPENVRQEAAEIFMINIDAVTDAQANEVIDQYKKDWKEWPVTEGAPYVDVNNNGSFDPVLDNDGMPDAMTGDYPGIKYAAQVVWFKVNDQDAVRTDNLYGSEPMGIEQEVTIWAYKSSISALNQAIFKKYKITNISSDTFNEMYLSQWSDPDLGSSSDDLVGCNEDLNSAFAYNGANSDSYFDDFEIAPPATAYTLLFGPIVSSPGDTAFFNSKLIADFKNLPMTSFGYFSAGNAEWDDPDLAGYIGTLQWYNLLCGYIPNIYVDSPTPFINRNTGVATKYPLNGNPVTGEGDIDGQGNNFPASDRRMCLNSGPFILNPGDSQEMVIALTGGLGENYLHSVDNLFTNIDYLYNLLRQGFLQNELREPVVKWSVDHPDSSTTNLVFQANLNLYEDVTSCTASIYPEFGDDEPIELTLFDDGMHEDNSAGDGIWGNSISMQNRKFPHTCDMTVNSASGTDNYYKLVENIRLRPVPSLENWRIIWENKYLDSKINNDETVHLQFDIKNNDDVISIDTISVNYNNTIYEGTDIIAPQTILPVNSYFMVVSHSGLSDSVKIGYTLNFDNHSQYVTSIFPVTPFNENVGDITINYEGDADGSVNVTIVDSEQLTGHQYKVFFKSNENKNYWNLLDMTTNDTLLKDLTVIDGVDIYTKEIAGDPIIDGMLIKVIGGYDAPTTLTDAIYNNSYSVANNSSISDYTSFAGYPDGRSVTVRGFGTTDLGELGQDYEMRWTGVYKSAPTVINGLNVWEVESGGSLASLWGARMGQLADHPLNPNPGSSDPFLVRIPFEVWNSNTGEKINLSIYDRTQNYSSNLDIYAFNPFGRMYTEFVNTPYDSEYVIPVNGGKYADHFTWNIVWWGNPKFQYGDVLNISYFSPLTADDYFIFTADPVLGIEKSKQPENYHLSQNYPNPFNPVTTISYQLKKLSNVELSIFNILGQKVKTLVNKKQPAGSYNFHYDASELASGVYIYRISAGSFVSAKKMVLLK